MSSSNVKIPRAFKPLFTEAKRYKGFYGGRGSGKSHSFATALLIKAMQQPVRILACREIQRSIKDSVKRLLDDKIDAMGAQSFFVSTDSEIRGANGSLFIFAGLRNNPETIKSLEGVDIAWVEEAHRATRESLDILLPTIRKEKSEIWFSWNPDSEADPVDALMRKNPPDNAMAIKVGCDDNPFFPDVLREEMEYDRQRDPDRYSHVWEGAYRKMSEARVFRNWRVEEFETPDDARLYFGADWGFANDPTVLVRCWIDGRKLYIDHEAYKIGCEVDKTPDLFDTVPASRKWKIKADSARPETISYMRRQGFKIEGAKKGKGSVEDGVEHLKSFDIIVHPRCKHAIDEMAHYHYKIDRHTDEILPVVADESNHCIDSARYALEDLRRGNQTHTGRVRGLM